MVDITKGNIFKDKIGHILRHEVFKSEKKIINLFGTNVSIWEHSVFIIARGQVESN